MIHIKRALKNNKTYLKIILIIFIVGFITSIIYYNLLSTNTRNSITNTLLNYTYQNQFLFKNLIIASSLLISVFFIIGIPLSFFYLFYESFASTFILIIMTITFGINGLLYSIIYIILTRLLIMFLFIIFIRKIINVGRLVIGLIIYKKEKSIKDKLIFNLKNSIYIIIFILTIDILNYFINPIIFSKLEFLLN